MDALIVFFIIVLVIVKHIGACARESSYNAQSKRRAMSRSSNNLGLYMDFKGGERLICNDHAATWGRDEYRGTYVLDLETKERYYPDLVKAIKLMREQRAKGKEGTVFKCSIPHVKNDVFIDYETEQLYFKAMFITDTDLRYETFFYTDLETRTKVFRKTDEQIAYEDKLKECGIEAKFYDMNDINLDNASTRSIRYANAFEPKRWNVKYEEHPKWRAHIAAFERERNGEI